MKTLKEMIDRDIRQRKKERRQRRKMNKLSLIKYLELKHSLKYVDVKTEYRELSGNTYSDIPFNIPSFKLYQGAYIFGLIKEGLNIVIYLQMMMYSLDYCFISINNQKEIKFNSYSDLIAYINMRMK